MIRGVSKVGATLAGLSLAACMLMDRPGYRSDEVGHVNLNLSLERPRSMLLKVAADTTFHLDSLIIVLTAPSSSPITYRFPIDGRADTGNVALPPLVFELPALRNWKAYFYSISMGDGNTRDTVHLDSAVFAVRPADTTEVFRTLSPAFAILRARFLSTLADSIPNNVVYARLRIDGVTRDSSMIGGKNASLRWLQALPGSVIFAAGDSGRILKSTNDAQPNATGSWVETVVTNEPLVGGHFPSSTHGYVVSISGKVFKTENAGVSWTPRVTTADSLNAVFFSNNSDGWAVGQNGGIYKTTTNAYSWYSIMVSNTTQHLRGVHFPTPEIGFVVGENETILRTRNGASGGDSPPENTGVVWTPVAGGWFPQTSQEATRDFTDIVFSSESTGWAIGKNGLLRLTTNGGATWQVRNISDLNGRNVNAIANAGAWNKVFAVADNGIILKSAQENDWQVPYGSGSGGTGTTENLNDIVVPNGGDTAYVVGNKGKILRSTNATTTTSPYVQWLPLVLPGPVNGPQIPAWDSLNSSTTNALHAVSFGSASVGWAVGEGGVVRKSNDSGKTWTSFTSAGGTKYALYAFSNGTDVIVAGTGGSVRRSNSGGDWNDATGLPATDLNGIDFYNDNLGWVVGASGTIRATDGGGWYWGGNRDVGSTKYNAVSVGNSRVWVVGDSGKVLRTNQGSIGFNNTFGAITPSVASGIGTKNLRGAYFSRTSDIGWVVGDKGLIVKLTNVNAGNANQIVWTKQSSGDTTKNLRYVRFLNNDTGYVVGDSGTILKTVNGGGTWAVQVSGTTRNLAGVFPQSPLRAIVVGASGTIRRTTSGGAAGGSAPNTRNLRGVHAVNSALVFVAGDSGTIGKTTNAGVAWTLIHADSVTTTRNLHDVAFANANVGWAVGENGTILKTTNGGVKWVAQTSGTTRTLSSVAVRSPDTVYVTGTGGLLLKTVNGGGVWYSQESPTTKDYNQVYFFNSAKGWAVGANGTISNAVNFGDNWTGGGIKRSLKGVYFVSVSTGWIVGNDGVILKTSDTGSTWIEQHREVGLQLYGVHFVNANTGWVTGEGGVILKTTNGGATWTPQTSHTGIDLQWVHFRDANRGFVIGGTESLLETSDGGANWGSQFVGAPGLRVFNKLLAYKRLKPGVPHQVVLQAVDSFDSLRGYQAILNLTVGAGIDDTILAPLTRCGYVDSIPCVP